ncbi:unnamed protein product [Didymodactylos carnosus]|uniref:Isoleucyl-tRNA synthetase n=1 Tax=Didymodactylos carnosus TaxID=1234261 RepID=A0A8S2EX38_9BILA|nr:unnamed protein product [Didymodactylos carnosus]CAF4143529.1 unnamed protein product [Didymodactylos carnosus]
MDEIIVNQEIIDHLIKQIDKTNSIDIWWSKDIKDILPDEMHNQENNLVRGNDIFDVWFDSGSSFYSILKDSCYQADLYTEGHDQFNGWFLSSLLLTIAVQSTSPFKTLFVHGFVVDKQSQKMSKSIGNVTSPSDVIYGNAPSKKQNSENNYFLENGLDVCREWVTRESYKPTCKASVEDFNNAHKRVFDIRNIFRFLIGNLYDYNHSHHEVSVKDLTTVDRYMAYRLSQIIKKYHNDFDQYSFYRSLIILEDFMYSEVSGFYCSITKDRLYCYPSDSYLRRSTQTVFYYLLKCLNERLAPIMPFLAQEIHNELKTLEGATEHYDVFHNQFTNIDEKFSTLSSEIKLLMTSILSVRDTFNSLTEGKRPAMFDCFLYMDEQNQTHFDHIKKFLIPQSSNLSSSYEYWEPLEEILQCSHVYTQSLSEIDVTKETMSSVHITPDNPFSYVLKIKRTSLHSCPRCRLFKSSHDNELCSRCLQTLELNHTNQQKLKVDRS